VNEGTIQKADDFSIPEDQAFVQQFLIHDIETIE